MINALLLLFMRIFGACIDLLAAFLSALAMRWLMGLSTPERDWNAFRIFTHDLAALFTIPDPFEGVNLAYLAHLRSRYERGEYRDDTLHEDTNDTTIVDADSSIPPPNTE